MDKLTQFLRNLNTRGKSVYLPYEDLLKEFSDNEIKDGGDGKWLQLANKNDNHIIIRFYMPKGTVFTANHHNCKEVIQVIYGAIKWEERSMYYNTLDKMRIPKDIEHTVEALKDSLCYAILYKPNEK